MTQILPDDFNQRAPVIDGVELPAGYGVLFEREFFLDTNILIPTNILMPMPFLVVWITKCNYYKREYEKHERIWPGHKLHLSIQCWDDKGRAWEFDDGVITLFEDKLDLDKEYEDE